MNKTVKIIVGIIAGVIVIIAILFAFNIVSYTTFPSQTRSLVEVHTNDSESTENIELENDDKNTAVKNAEYVPSCNASDDGLSQCAVPLEKLTSS